MAHHYAFTMKEAVEREPQSFTKAACDHQGMEAMGELQALNHLTLQAFVTGLRRRNRNFHGKVYLEESKLTPKAGQHRKQNWMSDAWLSKLEEEYKREPDTVRIRYQPKRTPDIFWTILCICICFNHSRMVNTLELWSILYFCIHYVNFFKVKEWR